MATPDQPLLFNNADIHSVLRNQEAQVEKAVTTYDADQLLAQAEHDIVAYLVEKELLDPPALDLAGRFTKHGVEEIQMNVRDDWYEGQSVSVSAQRIVLTVPFSGDKGFFEIQPSTHTLNPPRATVNAASLDLVFVDRTLPAEKLRALMDGEIEQLEKHLAWIRSDVAPFNARLPDTVARLVKERKATLLASRSVEAELGIPVRARQGPGTFSIPSKPKRVEVKPPPAAGPFKPEPALSQEHYEEAIRLILAWSHSIERTPEVFASIGEEDLRAHILVMLNSQFEGEAGAEMFNGAGKTDILVRSHDRNVFIGECKIWGGPTAFKKAIDQLLGYVVWRDSKAALILFIRTKNPTDVIAKATAALSAHQRCKRTLPAGDPSVRSDFVFHAEDDPSREIQLALLPIVTPAK